MYTVDTETQYNLYCVCMLAAKYVPSAAAVDISISLAHYIKIAKKKKNRE